MHAWIPRHSFVAPPAGANAAATASAATTAARNGSHTSLRNQTPEKTAPASMKTSPPPAATDVTSTVFRLCPTREPSSRVRRLRVDRLRAGDEAAAARPRDRLQHVGLAPAPESARVNPPLTGCSTTPSGVPTETAVDGDACARAPAAPPAAGQRARRSGRRRRTRRSPPAAACCRASPARPSRRATARATASASAVPCGPVRARVEHARARGRGRSSAAPRASCDRRT